LKKFNSSSHPSHIYYIKSYEPEETFRRIGLFGKNHSFLAVGEPELEPTTGTTTSFVLREPIVHGGSDPGKGKGKGFRIHGIKYFTKG